MANDDRNRPAAPARPPGVEPIKVRELRAQGSHVVLPPPARGGLLKAGARASGEFITIQYEPWQRHHRVREFEGAIEGGKIKTEVCIPEGWVSYTPEVDAP
jgi:hypothetical protein